jgi:hypothetical protein
MCSTSAQARKHVESFFLQTLLSLEEPLLPKDEKTTRELASKVGAGTELVTPVHARLCTQAV